MLKPSLAVGVLAAMTTLALAQTNPPSPPVRDPAMAPGAISPRGAGVGHHTREYRAQQAARISLVQAIETAESQGQGRAIEADFDVENGAGRYEVKVLGSDGKLVEHHVDAASGQVTKSENHPIEGFFTRLKSADVQNARTSLRQAITLAEQKAGGKAAEAEVEREDDAVRYKITVANGDRTQEVRIDANGQITP